MAGPPAIRGRVVLVPFPFDDPSGSKGRLAVCPTEPVGPHRHLVLAFVTGQVEPAGRRAGDAATPRFDEAAASTTGRRLACRAPPRRSWGAGIFLYRVPANGFARGRA
jgi:hypothetical protein